MSALDMTAVALFPHRLKGAMGSMDPSLATVIVMWWVMMIAMMTPSAAPLVMLYRRVLRQRGVDGAGSAFTSLSLLAGYLPHGSRSRSARRCFRRCCSRPG